MAFVFAGQATGSSAGPKLFLKFGWRACYALHLGFNVLAILILLARGPSAKGWLGWGGTYSLRKARPKEEREEEETVVELERKQEMQEEQGGENSLEMGGKNVDGAELVGEDALAKETTMKENRRTS